MRVALISYNARAGDAIGNQVAEKLTLFLERGADVRVYVESLERLHPLLDRHARQLPAEACGEAWDFLASTDLVCVEFGQYYTLLGLLPLLAGTPTRILLDYHGITPLDLWGGHNREALEKGLVYRGIAWCADLTLVHSRSTERELSESTGLPGHRINRLGLPIDPDQFFPNVEPGYLRRQLGLEGARLLLYVGRLAPNKRVHLLVDVLGQLRDVEPPVHALIVGDTGDLYRSEADRCLRRARELGVEERLHFLGHLQGKALRQAYQAADVFVMPSAWESFCVPVIEAMACGVPVVAARAFALPETVADAGLTFRVDHADDCVRQVRRILAGGEDRRVRSSGGRRVAIVSFRYGADFAGGAEWSLRRIGTTLKRAGNRVEVFTTCTRDESNWSDELPTGTISDDDVPVHRFRLDAHDRNRHLMSVQEILQAHGQVSARMEEQYITNSIHSTALVDELRRRGDDFDAIIVGPYLFGLTCAVARAFPEKTLLLPCFHNEPLVRLRVWQDVYEQVGGILFHSEEEREFAQNELGINHPGAAVIGTWLNERQAEVSPQAEIPTRISGQYVVYCGRYSAQKELPELLDFARKYSDLHPGRFTFVFIGKGEVPIPHEDWARDLGFISEAEKQKELAGASALIQLSRKESLSLVALEAWSVGTPVIASRGCDVLVGHLNRSGGGAAIAGFDSFATTLDELWAKPEMWQDRGAQGRHYVAENYESFAGFSHRLQSSVDRMALPLGEQMRRRGLERARLFQRSAWRERFAGIVDQLLHAAPARPADCLTIQPYTQELKAGAGANSALLSVRLINDGSSVLLPEGPARFVVCSRAYDAGRRAWAGPRVDTPLPEALLPGRGRAAVLVAALPAAVGHYQVHLWAQRVSSIREEDLHGVKTHLGFHQIDLVVEDDVTAESRWCAPFLNAAQAALTAAAGSKRLPDDYLDVTEGKFARWKRWLKRKLLNNFKHAYVDVLSRQQTGVNQQLINAVHQLTECCTALDHAVRVLQERVTELESWDRGHEEGVRSQAAAVKSQSSVPYP